MKAKAAHVFKTHPSTKEIFETSDEMLFFTKADAIAHSADLKDKSVNCIKKEAAMVEVAPEGDEELPAEPEETASINEEKEEELASVEEVKEVETLKPASKKK